MRHKQDWKPGKFVYRKGRLAASRDVNEVSLGSRLAGDIIAGCLEKLLGNYAGGRLLDLGCGKVPLYGSYKALVSDNTCVDWSNTLHGNPHLDFECDLNEPLPFENAEYNTVLLSDVLEHLPEPGHLMGEIARVLAPGGKLIMNVPFMYWVHEEPYDYYRYTSFTLKLLAENSGLKVLELEPTGGAVEVLTDIFAKAVLRVPVVGKLLSISAQWFTGLFTRTSIGKKVSRSTSEKFPMGYCMVAEKP